MKKIDLFNAVAATGALGKELAPKKGNFSWVVEAASRSVAEETAQLAKNESDDPTLNSHLAKSILNTLNGGSNKSIERLAFERDPTRTFAYGQIYRPKLQGVPDVLLKRIGVQDDLVAAIVLARSNHMSSFGRLQPDRFSKGFKIDPNDALVQNLDEEQTKALQDRIDKASKLLLTCGSIEKVKRLDRCTFSEWLKQSTRDGLLVGKWATEVTYALDESGQNKFHSFRPADAATIYYAADNSTQTEQIREQARQALERLRNEQFDKERVTPKADEIVWVQVIQGTPQQVFTDKEMLVHNLYPITDVEWGGYPLTPIDTMLAAVTTHINITNHNKAYFQSGRASRGMLVVKSNDINIQMVEGMRQQFNASINGVQNAWRMPVFGCTPEDSIEWQPIDSGGRDMEFQYLSDTNARIILSAFQMSPEELPGYQHLSRGTNTQALSESNEEYKLTAARDVGIRPLISDFEDFLNAHILPLIDPVLAKLAKIRLVGLDAETAEKESVRIQEDMSLHMTYNEILERVEKDPVKKEMGGEYPLNPQFQQVAEKYLTFGEILEYFFEKKGAAQKPEFQFYQNPLWFNWVQMQQQAQQMEQQAQQQAQAPQDPGQPPPQEGVPQDGQGDLGKGLDQLAGLLKAEHQLSPSAQKLRAQQAATNKMLMDAWEEDGRKALQEILDLADAHAPKEE